MRAVIIAGGNVCREQLEKFLREDDYVICADSGFDRADGIKPDMLLGDFDSIAEFPPDVISEKFPVRKDFTDSELAVRYALEKGYRELLLFGFTGGRMDHTIANLGLLEYIQRHGGEGVIIDRNSEIHLLGKNCCLTGKPGDLVSILPLDEELRGVKTEGLEYALDKETLYRYECRGVSNVMTGYTCRIETAGGKGFVIKSND